MAQDIFVEHSIKSYYEITLFTIMIIHKTKLTVERNCVYNKNN